MSEEKKKILMVCGTYPPRIGGAGAMTKRLAHDFVRRNCDVDLLLIRRTLNKHQSNKEGTVNIHWVPLLGISYKGVKRGATLISMIWMFLYVVFKGRGYDAIHVNQGHEPAFAVVLAAKIIKTRTVVTIQNSGEHFDLKLLQQKWGCLGTIIVKGVLLADAIVVLTEAMRDELLAYGIERRKTVCIPNGVDFDADLGVPYDSFPSDKKILIYTGRFTQQKNVSFLLELLSALKAEGELCYMVLAGEGELEGELKETVCALGLDDDIMFLLDRENVYQYLLAADVFLLPSFVEGLSNSLIEALCCGLPCVVSDIGANHDVAQKCLSVEISPVNDKKEWLKKVKFFLSDAMPRDHRRRQIKEELKMYDMQDIVSNYSKVFCL